MATSTTSASSWLSPEQVTDLIIRPVQAASVAFRTANVVMTATNQLRVPAITADPTCAFVAEGATISASDPTTAEILIEPAKVAGLTVCSRELIEDSAFGAAESVGRSIASDLARRIDLAYLTDVNNSNAAAPEHVGSYAGIVTSVTYPNGGFVDLDPIYTAIATSEAAGANIADMSIVAHPDEVLALSLLKTDTTDSNAPLLGTDPSNPTARQISGVPVIASAQCASGELWLIPKSAVTLALRQDADVSIDYSAYFSSDSVGVRVTARVSWAVVVPAQLVKLTEAAP